MVERREPYDEKLDLLMREAIAEAETTLGPGKRDAPAFWRTAREDFLRRLCRAADAPQLLRVLFGDETIGIKARPLFDRLKRAVPIARDDGGGTSDRVSEDQPRPVSPPSTGSEGGEAIARVSDDHGSSASSSSDETTTWEPPVLQKSPPDPRRPDDNLLTVMRRVWGGWEFKYRNKKVNIGDVPVHRLKPMGKELGEAAVRAVIPFNVVQSTLDFVERQAYVPPHSLVRDIVAEEDGEKILLEARQRAAGMLFMVPKGMRIPVIFHD